MDQDIASFTVFNEDGETIECEVLFTFESEDSQKNYIVYTDNTLDEDGFTKVYASVFNPEDENMELLPITEEEWELVDGLLQEMQAEMDEEESVE